MEKGNLFSNYNMMQGLLSEIMIDEQVRIFRKKSLYEQIDEALAMKNKERFMHLTNELKDLMRYEQETG